MIECLVSGVSAMKHEVAEAHGVQSCLIWIYDNIYEVL